MRHVALSAAIFGVALFLGPTQGSTGAPQVGAQNINTLISKQTVTNMQALDAPVRSNSVAKAELASAPQNKTDKPAPDQTAPAPVVVTVAAGDSLSSLAGAHGTTIERMYAANTALENPDVIHPGQQLRIPSTEEQLAPRALPQPAPAPAKVQSTPAEESAYTAPAQQRASTAPTVASGSVWDSLAQCEATGNWAINTGNGFYGGLQFTLSSWQAAGGSGYPHQASREEQILRGTILQGMQGWGAWPACSAKLGLR